MWIRLEVIKAEDLNEEDSLMAFLRRFLYAIVMLELIFSATAYSQQPEGASSPQIVTPLIQPQSTPQQQKAVQEAIEQKGLTPEAIEILKAKPEFQGLKPDDILKAKEELRKKEAQKFPDKQVIGEDKKQAAF